VLRPDSGANVSELAIPRHNLGLGPVKVPCAVELLIIALKDKEAKVRSSAARALGMLRDACALERLKAELECEARADQTVTGEALEKIGA
jgi:HEAT repeat protein